VKLAAGQILSSRTVNGKVVERQRKIAHIYNPGLDCTESKIVLCLSIADFLIVMVHPTELDSREVGRKGETSAAGAQLLECEKKDYWDSQLTESIDALRTLLRYSINLDTFLLEKGLEVGNHISRSAIVPNNRRAKRLSSLLAPSNRCFALVSNALNNS
jgi:hypothetical protein